MTYSSVKHQEENYRITINSIPNTHAKCIGEMSVRLFNLHTTAKLPRAGK